jgi:protein SCO1/2
VNVKGWARLACVALAIGTSCASVGADALDYTPLPLFERVMVTAPEPVQDFLLTDQNGKPFRIGALRGQPVLVFFGFAHCPDVCPAVLHKLATIQKSSPDKLRKVRVVMISVDGERDTPEVMRAYVRSFSPDFIGLTGAPADVHIIAARFSATFFKDPPKDSSGAYLVEHTSRVYALDRKGRLRAEMYDASPEATAGVMRALLTER